MTVGLQRCSFRQMSGSCVEHSKFVKEDRERKGKVLSRGASPKLLIWFIFGRWRRQKMSAFPVSVSCRTIPLSDPIVLRVTQAQFMFFDYFHMTCWILHAVDLIDWYASYDAMLSDSLATVLLCSKCLSNLISRNAFRLADVLFGLISLHRMTWLMALINLDSIPVCAVRT